MCRSCWRWASPASSGPAPPCRTSSPSCPSAARPAMPDDLLDRFRRGDRIALARLLSRLARGEGAADLLARLGPPPKPSRVVAVTGAAGVGKSTLVGKLIEAARSHGQTVA